MPVVTTQPTPALDALASMATFAYKEGFHEMGYDPVKTVRELLAEDRSTVDGARLQEALAATLHLASYALEHGYVLEPVAAVDVV